MRILLVHNRYRSTSPSGEDRVVDQESAALVDAGHVVDRFERSSDSIDDRSLPAKLAVAGRVVWSEGARRSLLDRLRAFRPDVVHVHNTFPLLSPSVLYAARAEGVPVVATLHNYRLVCPSGDLFRDGAVCHDCVDRRLPVPGVAHGCYRDSRAATLPLALGIVTHRRAWRTLVSAYLLLSSAQRDILSRGGLPRSRLFVKPNFVDEPPPHRGDPEDVVVFAGRLTAAKGIELLMEAWDRYSGGGAEGRLRLAVAGAGPLEDHVAAWASRQPSVDWLGMLDRAECTALVARARAVVVPSQWEEPFGLVAVEAMAAGVPAIAPARGSFPEIVTDGRDGVLFRPGDPGALAQALDDLESDVARHRELGRAARATYQRRFTREPNVRRLLEVYRFAMDHPAC